jgi:chemotaxis family two-component system response regulator Rcp1
MFLLIEDNPADVALLKIALTESSHTVQLQVAHDGLEGLSLLRQQDSSGKPDSPDLVLLDLNLPKLDGHSVLADIKSDPALRHMPVVILSASTNPDDIVRSYQLGANAYIHKSDNLEDFFATVKTVVDFWCRRTLLPSKVDAC